MSTNVQSIGFFWTNKPINCKLNDSLLFPTYTTRCLLFRPLVIFQPRSQGFFSLDEFDVEREEALGTGLVFFIFIFSFFIFLIDGPLETNITVNNIKYTTGTVEIKTGESVEIRCDSRSMPPASYEIKLRTNSPTQLNPDSKIGYYKIDKMKITDEGIYECIARNPILKKEQTVEVRVIAASKKIEYIF